MHGAWKKHVNKYLGLCCLVAGTSQRAAKSLEPDSNDSNDVQKRKSPEPEAMPYMQTAAAELGHRD